MTQAAILQVLGGGSKTLADLRNALPALSRAILDSRLETMRAEQFVRFELGQWRLTRKGLLALPKHSGPLPMRPYVAPKVIRRPGSLDASKLPSLAAGRRYYPDDRQ